MKLPSRVRVKRSFPPAPPPPPTFSPHSSFFSFVPSALLSANCFHHKLIVPGKPFVGAFKLIPLNMIVSIFSVWTLQGHSPHTPEHRSPSSSLPDGGWYYSMRVFLLLHQAVSWCTLGWNWSIMLLDTVECGRSQSLCGLLFLFLTVHSCHSTRGGWEEDQESLKEPLNRMK